MPQVGKISYSYSPAGIAMAKAMANHKGLKMKKKKHKMPNGKMMNNEDMKK